MEGVDFVDPNLAIRSAWKTFWPQTGNIPNWDAVGLLASNSHIEYLLVEAKAHIEELHSSCGAKQEGGLGAIQRALRATLTHFQSSADADNWLSPYYQYANRLAHLDFLLGQNVSARLVLIYFLGDEWRGETLNTKKATCPKAEQEWRAELEKVDKHLGLTGLSELEKRVHKLFLHV
jgi:hypothetical protein